MIYIDFWTGLADHHFRTSILDLLFGSCRRLLRQRSSHHPPPLHPVRPISFLRASFLFPIISNDFLLFHSNAYYQAKCSGERNAFYLSPQIRLLNSLIVQQFVAVGTQHNFASLHDITTIC
jgi:hypothetical protein